ncbi:MAG: iron-sulfur cluster repair di-iron protein [Acidobacteriota bacterium]
MAFETDTIAALAIANPSVIPTLEKLGIDYCCGGATTVEEACRRVGVEPSELRTLVGEPARSGGRAWEKETLSALIGFILETHHAFTRDAIAALPPLAAKVRGRHGDAHRETRAVEMLVRRLVEDLGPHLLKEEKILFPYVESLEGDVRGESCFGTVQNPVRMMMREHEAVGEILRELRAVTENYVAPPDACTSFQALYAGLTELEADLHRHIHLENNILFPGALALEEGRPRP